MKIYDLSHSFSINDSVFPGTPPMSYDLSHTIANDNYNLGVAHVNSHAGTHTDAPRHFLEEGATLLNVPLENYVGPCVVVDVRHKKALDTITIEDVQPYEQQIKVKKRVLLLTNWSAHHNSAPYFTDYPRVSLELADYLCALGVLLLGVEPPSLNPPQYIQVHQALLSNGVAVVEGLTNLESILGKEVIFCGAPLAFKEADGFPLRAFAIEV